MELVGLDPEWFEFRGAKYKLDPLRPAERLRLVELLFAGNKAEGYKFAVEASLKDWDGVDDENGPVNFDEKLIDRLPMEAYLAIANRVVKASGRFGEDAKKKS